MSIEKILELTFSDGLPFTQDGKPYEINDGEYYVVPSETMRLLIESRKENPNILEFSISDNDINKLPYKITVADVDYYLSGKGVLIDGKKFNVVYQLFEMDLEQSEEKDKP